ncbi:hypothetical protein AAT19DRAFT_11896 [Rhodotorula toruloides]|uniref:Uncharacterized protein n=1 Tax=Rhodotorula toruloides TaxID=5286 RepID=A0A2S9ZVU3_RHOTO|nr:hypothetical protein AAT19DRAFT_11896 [Rhodotorula toruloides]
MCSLADDRLRSQPRRLLHLVESACDARDSLADDGLTKRSRRNVLLAKLLLLFSFFTTSPQDILLAPKLSTTLNYFKTATMSSDAASTYSFSSTAPLTGAGSSPKSPSLLSKLLRRTPSPKAARPASPPKTAEETFREIMALNASHGDPSVQAYHLKTAPKTKTAKPSKSASPSPPRSPSSSSSPAAPRSDAFSEIMALNATHGDPSVQVRLSFSPAFAISRRAG